MLFKKYRKTMKMKEVMTSKWILLLKNKKSFNKIKIWKLKQP